MTTLQIKYNKKYKSRGRVEVGEEVGIGCGGWRDGEKMQTIITE